MTSDATAPADSFVGELKRYRDVRGLSQSRLAESTGYTPSYVSKVESGQLKPSKEFADNADRVLNAGGTLRRIFREIEQAGSVPTPRHVPDHAVLNSDGQPFSLIVEHEDSRLYYDGSMYRTTQRRQLYNASADPITRYLIRISVDRYPGNPERSNQLYRENPLTWEELGLTARIGDEPIGWRVQHDRDAFKEVWLTFENEYGRYPLYPGEMAWIEYGYTVTDTKWGTWYQRAVRLPTHRLSVTLDFPAELDPAVWGTETTMTASAFPFRTAIQQHTDGNRRIYAWSTDDPPLHARYRLEWKFRARPDEKTGNSMATTSASDTMRLLGILQEGDPILHQAARPFDLPAEAEDARRVVAELNSAAERVSAAHIFGKGMGIAAPQIGIDRAVAIVKTPGSDETITLINPRIIAQADQEDEQYEGCLSFFDVRCMVPRSRGIQVEHQDVDGHRQITIFEDGLARLVAHEVDHLFGVLCRDRMRPGVEPIPVTEYRGTGQQWQY